MPSLLGNAINDENPSSPSAYDDATVGDKYWSSMLNTLSSDPLSSWKSDVIIQLQVRASKGLALFFLGNVRRGILPCHCLRSPSSINTHHSRTSRTDRSAYLQGLVQNQH